MSENLKSRLANRELLFGAWVSFAQPSITEIFAGHGFDFLGIDMEHTTISLEQAQRIIAASQSHSVPCLPRPVSHSEDWIKPILDSGADGIIAPMVNSRSLTDNLVDLIKYPPVGKRSFGVNRAHNYGSNFEGYVQSWNANSVFIAQVETKEAVADIDNILGNPNLDGIMIGPYDLSGSLGVPGDTKHPRVQEAEKVVIEACMKAGKSCGTQIAEFDSAGVERALAMGYTFIIASSDLFVLDSWARSAQATMQKFQK